MSYSHFILCLILVARSDNTDCTNNKVGASSIILPHISDILHAPPSLSYSYIYNY